jgi:hypothetical protein
LNLRKELLLLRDLFYVGPNIKVVIQSGTRTLSNMDQLARDFFSLIAAVPNGTPGKSNIALSTGNLNNVVYMVEDINRLEIWWMAPAILTPKTTAH